MHLTIVTVILATRKYQTQRIQSIQCQIRLFIGLLQVLHRGQHFILHQSALAPFYYQPLSEMDDNEFLHRTRLVMYSQGRSWYPESSASSLSK